MVILNLLFLFWILFNEFRFQFRCDVLTIEIEHVDAATIEKLEQQGVDCEPKASTIRIIQVFFRYGLCTNINFV